MKFVTTDASGCVEAWVVTGYIFNSLRELWCMHHEFRSRAVESGRAQSRLHRETQGLPAARGLPSSVDRLALVMFRATRFQTVHRWR